MSDLVEFLRARLDEDERVALAAAQGPWRVDSETYAETIYSADDTAVVAGGRWGGEASVFESTADALHIARHDPARVLAEVGAKRRILDRHTGGRSYVYRDDGTPACDECGDGTVEWPCATVKLLALPYDYHPDYREEWRP